MLRRNRDFAGRPLLVIGVVEMKVYVARQPIFDEKYDVYGYELLYRSNDKNAYDSSMEENKATKNLLSDVITVFQLHKVTNQRYAFINFTKELLLQEIPKVLNSQDVVVEILEDVIPDEELIVCIKELKERHFKIALDDYCKEGPCDVLFPYADIIKVDLSLVEKERRSELSAMLKEKAPQARLLAEKVETREEFIKAMEDGYSLFQGYYFSKPVILSGTSLEIAGSTGVRLLKEINRSEPSYQVMADIIRTDVGMMYAMLKQINTLASYRGTRITNIKDALVRMGLSEIKKWTLLKLMRTMTSDDAEEAIRFALVRGVFAESVAGELKQEVWKEHVFMLGMFSVIDPEINDEIVAVLEEAKLFDEIKEALLGADNELQRILTFVRAYEDGRWEQMKTVFSIPFDAGRIASLYVRAVEYADEIFNRIQQKPESRKNY